MWRAGRGLLSFATGWALLTACMPRLTEAERAEWLGLNDDSDDTHVEDTDTDGVDTDTGDPPTGHTPVARCSVDPTTVAVGHEVLLHADASYFPDGADIERFDWSLVSAPNGTHAGIVAPQAPVASLTPDLAGEYKVQVVVGDEEALAAPCEASVTATSDEALRIELTWTRTADDLDLHLLRPGGALTSAADCYYGNCQGMALEWGESGTSGNPMMIEDDIPGLGPEVTVVTAPLEAGSYHVVVHDYPGSVSNGPNVTTVKVFLGGQLAWTETRDLDVAEGTYVEMVAIDGGTGEVISCPPMGCP